jgi:DNA-binding XRE family transcriptional regulator
MRKNWNSKMARQVRRDLSNLLDRYVSQVQLAEWLRYSRTAVQNWERGKSVPEPAVQFLYDKLSSDPGFITEIRIWSGSIYAPSEQQTSKASTG